MADEKRLDKIEQRFDRLVKDLNSTLLSLERKVDNMDSDRGVWGARVQQLEKQFMKFDKTARKSAKQLDPRVQKKSMLKMVDQALKEYDRKRG